MNQDSEKEEFSRRNVTKGIGAIAFGIRIPFVDGPMDSIERNWSEFLQDTSGQSNSEIEKAGREAFQDWSSLDYNVLKPKGWGPWKNRNKDTDPIYSIKGIPDRLDHGTYFMGHVSDSDDHNLKKVASILTNENGYILEDGFRSVWHDAVTSMLDHQREYLKAARDDKDRLGELGLLIKGEDGVIGKTLSRGEVGHNFRSGDIVNYAVENIDAVSSVEELSEQRYNQFIDQMDSEDVSTLYDRKDWYKIAQLHNKGIPLETPGDWVEDEFNGRPEWETEMGYEDAEDYF